MNLYTVLGTSSPTPPPSQRAFAPRKDPRANEGDGIFLVRVRARARAAQPPTPPTPVFKTKKNKDITNDTEETSWRFRISAIECFPRPYGLLRLSEYQTSETEEEELVGSGSNKWGSYQIILY